MTKTTRGRATRWSSSRRPCGWSKAGRASPQRHALWAWWTRRYSTGSRPTGRASSRALTAKRERRADGDQPAAGGVGAGQDGARHPGKLPSRGPAPPMGRNRPWVHWANAGQWPPAFWRRMSPSKNLAQGKLRTQLWWHLV